MTRLLKKEDEEFVNRKTEKQLCSQCKKHNLDKCPCPEVRETEKVEWAKKLKERFEANQLDGDNIDDCGGCMISAKEVFGWFVDEFNNLLLQEKAKWIKQTRDEVVKIITDSKATFFVNKGQKLRVPTDEALYELKAEIVTNCELYFYKILES